MSLRNRLQGRETQFYIEILYGFLFIAGFGYLVFRVDPRLAAFEGGLVVGYLLRIWEKMSIYERILEEVVSREAEFQVESEVEEQVESEVEEQVGDEVAQQVGDEVEAQVDAEFDERISDEVDQQLTDEFDDIDDHIDDRIDARLDEDELRQADSPSS